MPANFTVGFSVREPMWHGLGRIAADYPGREEAMCLAGHDHLVREEVILDASGLVIPGYKSIVRADTGEILAIARASYGVIQNATAWDAVDAIVAQPNVKYETGGILGRKIYWVLARLDEPVFIHGDTSATYPYVYGSWDHGGLCKMALGVTAVRIVCQNTWNMARGAAQAQEREAEISFRHTRHVEARINEAREVIRGLRGRHAEFIALATDLAKAPVSDRGLVAFTERFIPLPPGEIHSDRVVGNVKQAREAVMGILNGPTCVSVRNSAYGMLCGGLEYLDWVRRYRSKDTLMHRTILSRERLKDALVPLVREVADEFRPGPVFA